MRAELTKRKPARRPRAVNQRAEWRKELRTIQRKLDRLQREYWRDYGQLNRRLSILRGRLA